VLANGTVLQWGAVLEDVPAAAQGAVRVRASQRGAFAWLANGTMVHWGTSLNSVALTNLAALNGLGIQDVASTHQRGYVVLLTNGTLLNFTMAAEATAPPAKPASRLDGVSSLEVSGRTDDPTFVAVLRNGSIRAWGLDDAGQASEPSTSVTNAVAAAAGGNHTLILQRDGSLGAYGTIDGEPVVPPSLRNMRGVAAVGAGKYFCAVLLNNSKVRMWGWNIMDPPVLPSRLRAAEGHVVSVSAGSGHALVLLDDANVLPFGQDSRGCTVVPDEVQSHAVAIAAGSFHSLVLLRGGRVVSFGWLNDSSVPDAARSNVRLIVLRARISL
jgi:hypothetical protein